MCVYFVFWPMDISTEVNYSSIVIILSKVTNEVSSSESCTSYKKIWTAHNSCSLCKKKSINRSEHHTGANAYTRCIFQASQKYSLARTEQRCTATEWSSHRLLYIVFECDTCECIYKSHTEKELKILLEDFVLVAFDWISNNRISASIHSCAWHSKCILLGKLGRVCSHTGDLYKCFCTLHRILPTPHRCQLEQMWQWLNSLSVWSLKSIE